MEHQAWSSMQYFVGGVKLFNKIIEDFIVIDHFCISNHYFKFFFHFYEDLRWRTVRLIVSKDSFPLALILSIFSAGN